MGVICQDNMLVKTSFLHLSKGILMMSLLKIFRVGCAFISNLQLRGILQMLQLSLQRLLSH